MSGRPQPKVASRNQLLLAHLLAGGTVKAFAFDHGISRELAGRNVSQIHMRKYYLTEAEYAEVMRRRAGRS